MTQYIRAPRSSSEWGVLMIGLMVLFGILFLSFLNFPLSQAVGMGAYIGGTTAIFLMILYVFWRGVQSIVD